MCRPCEGDRTRTRLRTEPHRRAYRSKGWTRARAAALARDRHRCSRCGGTQRLEVHHVRPLSQGGSPFGLDNLRTLCPPCHRRVEADAGEVGGVSPMGDDDGPHIA